MDNISSRLVNDERANDLNNNNVKAEPRKTFTCQFKVSDIMVPNKTHHSKAFSYKDIDWCVYVEADSKSKHLAGSLCCDGPFTDWIMKADFDLKLVAQTSGTKDKCFKFTNCLFDSDGKSPFKREIYQTAWLLNHQTMISEPFFNLIN